MFHRKLYSRTVFYPTYWWNRYCADVRKIRNWWDRIDEHLIVGALPRKVDVQALHKAGVRAVVNTCEEYAGPVKLYDELGIEHLRIPTIDFTHPLIDDVESAVAFMNRHADKGNTIYVHCKAGRARSATVALCWLMQRHNMTAEAAQALLLSKRSHINPRLTARPVVKQFAQKHSLND
jgi:atypical dual specificity phosphatase